jgi:SP family arabinose:H+ symporter-like MFS transporter
MPVKLTGHMIEPVNKRHVFIIAQIVSLGGFLMGFDASVISGVVGFIEPEFGLSKIEIGWAVSSLTLSATFAMLVAGPMSDRFGRKRLLMAAALTYMISAFGSAIAPSFVLFVGARMVGGLGVGISLIVAPMYIAEMAPAKIRGQAVSFNQLNIVTGISAAFLSNYIILKLGGKDLLWVRAMQLGEYNWRWMLAFEAIPAVLYFWALFFIPSSPRWLIMKGKEQEARSVMVKYLSGEMLTKVVLGIRRSLGSDNIKLKAKFRSIFRPAFRTVLLVGIVLAILQQITGINAVFFYAPMIFEQSGIGKDASFSQAIYVGLTNLVFTIIALWLIDKTGRKVLLLIGITGITAAMFVLSYGFSSATYQLKEQSFEELPQEVRVERLRSLVEVEYESDIAFKEATRAQLGDLLAKKYESQLIKGSIRLNSTMILIAILVFVASFALSLGPVMWVLFSELFPNNLRALAVSFVGTLNSLTSFLVQLAFPWELDVLGVSNTFLIYGVMALGGFVFVVLKVKETKGKSLEELELLLLKER